MNKAKKEPRWAGVIHSPCAQPTRSERMSPSWPCLCPYQELWEGESREGAQIGKWGGEGRGEKSHPLVQQSSTAGPWATGGP